MSEICLFFRRWHDVFRCLAKLGAFRGTSSASENGILRGLGNDWTSSRSDSIASAVRFNRSMHSFYVHWFCSVFVLGFAIITCLKHFLDSWSGLDENSVDLLFVDGDHDYNATFQDLKSWSRFVRSGGIVSGHDIFNPVNDGVTDAVEDFLRGTHTVVRFATDHVYWWYS